MEAPQPLYTHAATRFALRFFLRRDEENRARFLRLHAGLQPAFLSREETVESKRALLGYFYREPDSILP